MNKLQIAANGHPRTNNDLIHLQNAIMEIGSALGTLCADAAGTNNPIVIGGLQTTDLGGGLFTYDPGWFFYNNEVFYFPGTTANLAPPDFLRISSTYTANNPYLGKNIHNVRTLIPIYGAGVTGDVAFNLIQRGVENIIEKGFANRTWNSVNGQLGRPNLIAANVTVIQAVKVLKDVAGCIRFQGVIEVQLGQSVNSVSVITLPVGYRVNSKRRIALPIVNPPFSQSTQDNPTDHFALLDDVTNEIHIYGDFCDYIGGAQSVDLSGINYYADL